MKRLIGSFLIGFIFLNAAIADEVVINAKELVGDEKTKITHLKGDVRVNRNQDKLECNEAYIFLDKNNRPNKIQALGDVKFWLTLENGRKVEGKGDEVVYFPNNQEYQILGNAMVVEPSKGNKVRGKKIVVRYKNGYVNVVGEEDAPVQLIFRLEKEEQ